MANESKSLPIAVVFSNLFRGLPRLLLTNLLFAIPTAAFYALFYAINQLTGLHLFYIQLLTIIPLFPFYAGVVKVTLHIAQGEEHVAVVTNFIAGVRDNFLRFLVHGVLLYIAIFFTYSSVTMYFRMGAQNPIFYALMVFSVIVGIILLFFFFQLCTMTVSFELPMKALYRNSFLMSFGELKSNIIALFGLFLLTVICSSLLMFCGGNPVALLIVTAVLVLLIVPAVAAFIINAAVYKRMFIMITDREAESKNVDQKLSDKRRELENLRKKRNPQEEADELRKLDIDGSADGDEYIYYKGKMMKRSVLLKMKQEAEESEMK